MVFLVLAITFPFLFTSTVNFQNPNALPGMIIIDSFAVSFSLLIFFWEMNGPINISFYEVVKMVLSVGCIARNYIVFVFFLACL